MPGLGLRLALALALAGAAVSPCAAAAGPKKTPELPGEVVEFPTRDGWTISGVYLPSKEKALTFVLLHDAKGRHQDWYPLARAMAKQGLGYLAVDLRGHNLSQKPPEGQPSDWKKFTVTKAYNEWDNMREDAAAAVAFLVNKGVAETNIGLGGADVGGSVAVKYAAVHGEVPMVFLLSPGMSYREVLTVNAMRAYKNRPVLMVVGDDDAQSVRETAILYQFAKMADGPENVTLLHVARRHGTRMLGSNRGLADKILAWIDNPIQFQSIEMSTDTLLKELSEPPADPASGGDGLPSEDDLDRTVGQKDGG